MMLKKRAGFTLIELLVVIVMIGILSVIAVPDFRNYQMRENLRGSVTETKAFFAEAFAQARAQSQLQRIEVSSDRELRFYSVDKNGVLIADCDSDPLVNCKKLLLSGSISMTAVYSGTNTVVTGWDYTAPHGDLLGLSSSVEIAFEHKTGAIKKIKVYPASGLVEEIQ